MQEENRHTGNKKGDKPECPVRYEELKALMRKARLVTIVLGGPPLGGQSGFAKDTTQLLGAKGIQVYHLSFDDEPHKLNATKEGDLVGSDTVMELMYNRIRDICSEQLKDGERPDHTSLLLLDGVPHTFEQAGEIQQMLGDRLLAIIVLQVSLRELTLRQQNVWNDDDPDWLGKRIRTYFGETIQVLESMGNINHPLLQVSNGKGEAAQVLAPFIFGSCFTATVETGCD